MPLPRLPHPVLPAPLLAFLATILRAALAGCGACHRQFAIIDGPGDSAMAQERKAGIVVSGNYDYASGGVGLRKVIDRLGRL